MSFPDFTRRDRLTGTTWAEHCERMGITAKNLALGQEWERRKAEKIRTIEHEPTKKTLTEQLAP